MEVTDSFFQKNKSFLSPKLRLKSILLFYKDLLEIKSCLKPNLGKSFLRTIVLNRLIDICSL